MSAELDEEAGCAKVLEIASHPRFRAAVLNQESLVKLSDSVAKIDYGLITLIETKARERQEALSRQISEMIRSLKESTTRIQAITSYHYERWKPRQERLSRFQSVLSRLDFLLGRFELRERLPANSKFQALIQGIEEFRNTNSTLDEMEKQRVIDLFVKRSAKIFDDPFSTREFSGVFHELENLELKLLFLLAGMSKAQSVVQMEDIYILFCDTYIRAIIEGNDQNGLLNRTFETMTSLLLISNEEDNKNAGKIAPRVLISLVQTSGSPSRTRMWRLRGFTPAAILATLSPVITKFYSWDERLIDEIRKIATVSKDPDLKTVALEISHSR